MKRIQDPNEVDDEPIVLKTEHFMHLKLLKQKQMLRLRVVENGQVMLVSTFGQRLIFYLYKTGVRIGAFFRKPAIEKAHVINSNEPPAFGEFLLGVFASKRQREQLLGDLCERFNADVDSGMSASRAKRRYWSRVLSSIWPQVWASVKRVGVVAFLTKMLN